MGRAGVRDVSFFINIMHNDYHILCASYNGHLNRIIILFYNFVDPKDLLRSAGEQK